MDENELLSCHCDLLVDLTYQDTFRSLDERFIAACAKLLNANHIRLHLGNHLENITAPILHEFIRPGCERTHDFKTVLPLNMTSGQSLSLFIDKDLGRKQTLALFQLITVYCNQHEHLTRSNKDKLTGLKNRRSFDLEYQRLTKQNQKGEVPNHVIAVIDIDHFKRVNDEYGHIIGDETLITISNLMKSFFEKDDALYRFGGEEFIVLLKDMDELEAEIILEQLREEIAHYHFPQIGQKTISIGFVSIRFGEDSTLLFERADAALYYAKRNGRNCVKNYRSLVQSGKVDPVESRSGEVEIF